MTQTFLPAAFATDTRLRSLAVTAAEATIRADREASKAYQFGPSSYTAGAMAECAKATAKAHDVLAKVAA